MMATSSHLLNLRPTSRSMPTSSKPHDRCRAIEASLEAEILAWAKDIEVAQPSRREPVKLGELLLKENMVTPQQLQEALSHQKMNGGKLGKVPAAVATFATRAACVLSVPSGPSSRASSTTSR